MLTLESAGVLNKRQMGRKAESWEEDLSGQSERAGAFESVVSKTKLLNLSTVNLTEYGTAFVTEPVFIKGTKTSAVNHTCFYRRVQQHLKDCIGAIECPY